MVQNIGRLALKKGRRHHVSNSEIYEKLGILPIKIVCVIQVLSFWTKQFHEPAHSIIKSHIESSFANRRQTAFKSSSNHSPLITRLISCYDFYKNYCHSTGKVPIDFKKLTKKDLDNTFSDLKSTDCTIGRGSTRFQLGFIPSWLRQLEMKFCHFELASPTRNEILPS